MYVIQVNDKTIKYISKIWISASTRIQVNLQGCTHQYRDYYCNFSSQIRRAVVFNSKQEAINQLNKLCKIAEKNQRNAPSAYDDTCSRLFSKSVIVEKAEISSIVFSSRSSNPKTLPVEYSTKDSCICSFCKVYIPTSFPYVKIGGYKVCGFCIKIMNELFDFNKYAPHEDAYKAERLINSL